MIAHLCYNTQRKGSKGPKCWDVIQANPGKYSSISEERVTQLDEEDKKKAGKLPGKRV